MVNFSRSIPFSLVEQRDTIESFIEFHVLLLCRYEPLSHLLGKEYFLHAYGPIYALSADVVSILVALKNDRSVQDTLCTILIWYGSYYHD